MENRDLEKEAIDLYEKLGINNKNYLDISQIGALHNEQMINVYNSFKNEIPPDEQFWFN